MTQLRHAIILGAIREGRFGAKPARWLEDLPWGGLARSAVGSWRVATGKSDWRLLVRTGRSSKRKLTTGSGRLWSKRGGAE
jgi:hypothetical protein